MMGHDPHFVKNGMEADTVWARHRYCYLKNRPKLVKFCKRQITKRERKERKIEVREEIDK